MKTKFKCLSVETNEQERININEDDVSTKIFKWEIVRLACEDDKAMIASGVLILNITNPDSIGFFEKDKHYSLDFTLVKK